jgi:glucosyl-dolichyl phosphate glucuronosyltransferase
MTLKASVIVNTHNRPGYLEGCLRALARQNLPQPDYEIVVVDNSSVQFREANRRAVDAIAGENRDLTFRYAFDDVTGGLTHSRNLAVTLASTNVIVQVDDDSLPCPDYVATAVSALSPADVVLVKGRLVAKYEGGAPDPDLIERLKKPVHGGYIIPDLTVIDLGSERVEISAEIAYASNCAFKKDFYLGAGGFGPDGFPAPFLHWNGSGEYNYARAAPKMGHAIWYEPGMSADHIIPTSRLKADFFFARSFYYGIAGSVDLISQGTRPFSIASIKYILRRGRAAAAHALQFRFFEARREAVRIKGFMAHQLICLRQKELVEYCRRSEWLSFDFSTVTSVGHSKARSQW